MKTTDEELVRATLNGDKTAFGTLVRKYQNAVYGLAYSLVESFSDAQDLTQEAFIRAYLDLYQLREHAKFAGWLCQVARNVCRMWIRRQKGNVISLEHSIETGENGVLDLCDSHNNPVEIVEGKELQKIVFEAVNSLPELDKTAITLFYMDGLTYREISEFLDVSVSLIKSRLHRAKKKLKGELFNMVQDTFANNRLGDEFAQKVLQSISTFNEINDIALSQDGKSVWCATWGGVTKFDIRTSSFTKYTTADGLRDNTVMAIAIDASDRVWCATADGVCMFDGEKWNACSDLPPDIGMFAGDMDDITIDTNGTVWLSTHGWVWKGKTQAAVCKLEGESWKLYPIDEKLEGIGPVIYADKDGRIWYGARHGVSILQDDRWVTYLLERDGERNHVFSILQDTQGNMWFGTGKGVWKFDGSDWTVYSSDEGLKPGSIKSLAEDRDGSIWAGRGSTLYSFDGTKWIEHRGEEMQTSRIQAIVVDDRGDKWIGTSRDGLYKFDGVAWTNYSVIKTLPGSYVTDVVADKQGNLWVATDTSGIARYDGQTWQYYSRVQNVTLNSIGAMFFDADGYLWLGTSSGGVCKLDSTGWKVIREEEQGNSFEQQMYWIESIAQDGHGNLWFVTIRKGVWKFDGKEWTQFTVKDGLPVDTTYALFIDSNNIVWVGTSRGVCKYDGTSWITVTEEGTPVGKHVFCIAASKNQDIWFGTWKDGAYRYDGKSWSCYTSKDGLADDYVKDIVLDKKGRLWFGTNNGLSCFDEQTWTSYGTEHGLASRAINSLAIDNRDVLWIGTMGGLSNMNLAR